MKKIFFRRKARFSLAVLIALGMMVLESAPLLLAAANNNKNIGANLAKIRNRSKLTNYLKKGEKTIRFKRKAIKPERIGKEKKDNLLNSWKLYKPKKDKKKQYRLAQFDRLPSLEEREILKKNGIRLLRYVPDDAYWVSIDSSKLKNSVEIASIINEIRWEGTPSAEFKISEAVDKNLFPPNAVYKDKTVKVSVLIFEDVSKADIEDAVNGLGKDVRILGWKSEKIAEARTPLSRIAEIAALDQVEWVEPALPPKVTNNAVSSQRIHVDQIRSAPLDLDGSGITVGVWDGGAVYPHGDFGVFDSRLTLVENASCGEDAPQSCSQHATHVAGTIGGSSWSSPEAKGMAPAVELLSYDWDNDYSEMRQAKVNGQIEISNHSYGLRVGWDCEDSSCADYGPVRFGLYDSEIMKWDGVIYDTDLLVFKSAGNDRDDCNPDDPSDCDGPFDSISYAGVAKNVITIGALTDGDEMTGFSSWGPADDGRIKPDLCANGEGLYSTYFEDWWGWGSGTHEWLSGTSMASPSAAGAAALLYQHFRNINNGSDPQASAMKALMIHGADDLGRPGPDYEYGWGLINAARSADLITQNMWRTGVIEAKHHSVTYKIDVTENTPEVKATLVWTDPAGSPSAAKALVNDLDLVVTGPNGTEYFPWTLDKDDPEVDATTGVNNIDNVEQALVGDPVAGEWTVSVKGGSVPEGPQSFSLALSSIPLSPPVIFPEKISSKIVADDGSADNFGGSISVSGSYAIVGAAKDDANKGSAYIFKYDGTSWNQETKLFADDGSSGDYFGSSVYLDGDYAIVGAPASNAAYVFKHEGDNWTQQAKLEDGGSDDNFGWSVSIDGGYAIVGMPFDDAGGGNAGAVHIYERVDESWSLAAQFYGATGQDALGVSVSIDGHYAVAGTWGDNESSARIFERINGVWTEVFQTNGFNNSIFSNSFVSVNGDHVAVGADSEDMFSGAVYVYKRGSTGWSQQSMLTASDKEWGSYFGSSVSINGNYLLVGSDGSNGSAYIFKLEGNDWTQKNKFISDDGSDFKAWSVALNNGNILIDAFESVYFHSFDFDNCVPPSSGDWIIIESCVFTGAAVAPASVIVQDNAVLTIDGAAALDIDFVNYDLKIKDGSGLLIKDGGKLH